VKKVDFANAHWRAFGFDYPQCGGFNFERFNKTALARFKDSSITAPVHAANEDATVSAAGFRS
jgi:hypothetical protein